MESVVLVIHLVLAVSIIGLVLLQRSEGGGLGIGGGGGGLGGFASARGTANALTKLTSICAFGFFVTSLTLGVLAGRATEQASGLLENIDPAQIETTVPDEDVSAPVGVTYTPPSEIKENLSTQNSESSETGESEVMEEKTTEEQPSTTPEEPSAPTE